MKKNYKSVTLFAGIALLVLLAFSFQLAYAQTDRSSGAIWTTDGSCGGSTQDENHFNHGDVVYINGSGFDEGSYSWTITGQPGNASDDPGDVVASGTFNVDSSGSFCINAYTIPDDDGGEYSVKFGNKGDNYDVARETSSVLVSVGACTWTLGSGSERSISLTISGASVLITKSGGGTWGPYTSSTSVSLPAGSYSYTYTATDGHTGSGSGNFTVTECPEATVSVVPDVCVWDSDNKVSKTDVSFNISNATVTLSDSNGVFGTYSSTQVVSLTPGNYSYTWTANTGYQGSGSGSFTVIDCEPGKGTAAVDVGSCAWDPQTGSLVLVTLTLSNAELTIDGEKYTSSTEIKLAPGTYAYSWSATGENTGSGSGSITVEGCEPAKVEVNVGVCEWLDESSLTNVDLNISGATLTLKSGEVVIGTYAPGNYSISLSPGSYSYTWESNTDYTGSGSGSFTVIDCEPGKADAAVDIGACVFDNGSSLTSVSISLVGAELTIDGNTYTETASLKLSPGIYPYSWVALDESFAGSGEGSITIASCQPKETVDPEPDMPAGGVGPSFFSSVTPFILGLGSVSGLAALVLNNKNKKIK